MAESHEERNRAILRRTLAAISHLYALFSFIFGASLLAVSAKPVLGLFSLAQGALYGAAGVALWKPRKGALVIALLAALGSIALAVLDFTAGRRQSIVFDGMYALVALILIPASRPRA